MKSTLALILTALAACNSPLLGALVYNIDVGLSSTTNVKAGYTALVTPFSGSGGSVTIDGDLFQVGGNIGSRLRTVGGLGGGAPDNLTADFAYANTGMITLTLGSAGGLELGIWEISVYSSDYNIGSDFNQRVGIIKGVTETVYSSSVDGVNLGPATTFQFTSDGVSAYSLFLRDAVAAGGINDAIRLNGIDLTFIAVPEPSTALLGGLGLLALLRRRR